ncbi:MAG: hypothetical protein U0935_16405 [Pirellulales bacterium]
MAQYYGDDDDCPDPNNVALFAEMHFDRVELTTRFDLSDGPESHQRKDEVRLLLDVLGKPSRMTHLLVMRACATPEILADEMPNLVMKPNGVRSSSHRVPILGEFGKKFPIRVKDPRWLGFGRVLSDPQAKLVDALPYLARNGLDAPVNWADGVVREARRFLSSQSTNETWPVVPKSWCDWRRFVELDEVLVKVFYANAKRHSREPTFRKDLVALIREEVFLAGICNAERRFQRSKDLRGGAISRKVLKGLSRRFAKKLRELADHSGKSPKSAASHDSPPIASSVVQRVQRESVSEERWRDFTDGSADQQELRKRLRDLRLELTDLEWVMLVCHANGMKSKHIVAELRNVADGYDELASVIEAGHDELSLIAGASTDEANDAAELADVAKELREDAAQLREFDNDRVRKKLIEIKDKARRFLSDDDL